MKLKLTVLLLSVFCGFSVYGQTNYSVKGLVIDTASKLALEKATVCVLNAKDSILQKFSYTEKGGFDIKNLQAGKYLLMVTYPDYADFVENFNLDAEKPVHNFNKINMILKATLLDEVMIKARVVAIKINGDTTEFNAAAYATQKNAKADDLLKQLPGMKINQNGAIIFQGEQVSKLLVDGEEFFSDDPTLVSKTVRADMISKVQVYDQKSEEAKNTGIDDGVKVKTINLVLSEDKRKGLFGKVTGGYGTDDFYETQAMLNKFKPKQKISVYGNFGNTGKVGLNSADNSKYGSGYGNGDYGGDGLPLARDGGVHFDTKWNKDKQSINTNYKIGALNKTGESSRLTQNSLPGNFNNSSSISRFDSYTFNQSADLAFNTELDSTSNIALNVYGSSNNSTYENTNTAFTVRGNGILQNNNLTSSNSDNDNRSARANARYTKRLKKKGRSFSFSGGGSASQNNSNIFQKSDVTYYDEMGAVERQDKVNQYKPGSNYSGGVTSGISYTDVFFKSATLNAGYSFSRDVSDRDSRSYSLSGAGKYDVLDSVFSSDFKLVDRSNTYSLSLGYSNDKNSVTIASSVSDVSFKQTDQFRAGNVLSRSFINWKPNARYWHKLSKSANISVNYYGYTFQPSVYDLQPLRQNADPLNIRIGNPNLRPAFTNGLDYRFYLYEPTLDRGINFRGSFSNTVNAMVSNRTTDSSGVNTYQTANLKGKQPTNWNVYGEVYGHATKLDFIAFISMTISGNTRYNYVNTQLQKSKSVKYSPELDITKNKTFYSYSLSIGPTYTVNTSSLQQIDNNTRGFFSNLSYYTKLPYNFFMGSDLNYNFTAKNKVFDRNFEQLLLKSYFGRSFLKEEGLKLSVTGNDLFNQNTGYSRTGYTDSFTESRNTSIGRYFMFSVSWDFSKFGKSMQKQQP